MKIDCVGFVENLRKSVDLTERKELVVIQVGDDIASNLYIKSKQREAEKWNIECKLIKLPYESTTFDVIKSISFHSDSDGIIVQLPLPEHIDTQVVIDAIPPQLNVDGFKQTGRTSIYEPCTPRGIMMLLESLTDLEGKMVTLIGRGKTVGEPLRDMLLKKNCTLAVCHSKSRRINIFRLSRMSDIVISAVGEPNFFNHEWLRELNPVIVIDAGISRIEGKQVGDFSHESKDNRTDLESSTRIRYTPWTNGVGKLTVAALMLNVRGILNV